VPPAEDFIAMSTRGLRAIGALAVQSFVAEIVEKDDDFSCPFRIDGGCNWWD